MPIRLFLPHATFEPELISLMSSALDQAVQSLRRPLEIDEKEGIAALIISAAEAGERNLDALVAAGLRFLGPLIREDRDEQRTG